MAEFVVSERVAAAMAEFRVSKRAAAAMAEFRVSERAAAAMAEFVVSERVAAAMAEFRVSSKCLCTPAAACIPLHVVRRHAQRDSSESSNVTQWAQAGLKMG
jgi:hypothetical protein